MSGIITQSGSCGCTAQGLSYCGSIGCCAPQISNCCYRVAIPVGYENVYFDVNFDGNLNGKTAVDLEAHPNDHTFNLTLDALPSGWLYDPIKRILYYPMNYRPMGRFAVWTAPVSANSSGGYTWTVEQVVAPPVESIDCTRRSEIAQASNGQYYCLTAQVLTSMTLALSDLRDVFGIGLQVVFNGGTTDPSTFQVALSSAPIAWSGSVNVVAASWTNGRCPSLIPVFDLCTAMAAVEDDFPPRSGSIIVVWSPTGCYTVPLVAESLSDLLTLIADLEPNCDDIGQGVRFLTPSGYRRVALRPTHRTVSDDDTLVPSTDQILYIDATDNDVDITLIAPSACDPTEFTFARIDASVNAVNLNFAPGIESGTSLVIAANGHVTLHFRNPEFRIIK